MVKVPIPKPSDPTLDAIDAMLVAESLRESKRDYLGASSIGEPCERKLWYSLNSEREAFKADTLRRFIDGHRTEELIVSWFRKLPFIELKTHKENGEQYGFTDGKFKGHYDGMIKGILQAPKTWHIFEVKCTNENNFKKLKALVEKNEKSALAEWSPTYYAQAVVYMAAEGFTRHYLVCATPGGRELTSVRTDENPKFAAYLSQKAHRIIDAKEPPMRLSNHADWYQCKMCSYHKVCHG